MQSSPPLGVLEVRIPRTVKLTLFHIRASKGCRPDTKQVSHLLEMFLIIQGNHISEYGQFLFEYLIEVIAKDVDCPSVSLVLRQWITV